VVITEVVSGQIQGQRWTDSGSKVDRFRVKRWTDSGYCLTNIYMSHKLLIHKQFTRMRSFLMVSESQVFKSNSLVAASYRLTIQEQRILLACIAQVSPKNGEEITDQVMYKIKVSDIEKLSGSKSKSLYKDIKDAVDTLFERRVTLTSWPNGKGYRKARITRWVQSVEYDDSEGSVLLRFSTDIAPYLNNLSEQYTKYSLSEIAKLTSAHAVRVFELMMQWKTIGHFTISLIDLKRILCIEDEYKKINDFKKRVIDLSVEQINQNTEYKLAVDQKKTGRRITHFIFNFSQKSLPKTERRSKNPTKLDLKDPKFLSKHGKPGENTDQVIRRLKEQFNI